MGRKYETRRAWVKMTHSTPYYAQQGTGNRPRRVNCIHLLDVSSQCEMYIRICRQTHFLINVILRKELLQMILYSEKRPAAKVDFRWGVCVCVWIFCIFLYMWANLPLHLCVFVGELHFKSGGLQLSQLYVCAGMSTAECGACVRLSQNISEETLRSQEVQGYSDTKGENTSVELRDQTSCEASW